MASYFVANSGAAAAAVHDRGRCPPASFPLGSAEYLGEFSDEIQALAVARLRFPQARHCPCCTVGAPRSASHDTALAAERS